MQVDHRALGLNLCGESSGQGIEGRLTHRRRQAGFPAAARHDLSQTAKALNGLVLPGLGLKQGVLKASGYGRRLFGAFHVYGPMMSRGSAAVAQFLQQEGELFCPGEGGYNPGCSGCDAEDNEDAAELPVSDIDGLNFTSIMAEAI